MFMEVIKDLRKKRKLKQLQESCFGIRNLTPADVDRIMAERPDVFRKLGE